MKCMECGVLPECRMAPVYITHRRPLGPVLDWVCADCWMIFHYGSYFTAEQKVKLWPPRAALS